MACDLSEIVEVIEFMNDIIGTSKKIMINSYIYNHDDNNGDETHKPRNSKYDIHIIDGTAKPIECADILKVFIKMQNQFKNTYEGRSYAFEGMKYNKKEKCYELYWAS